MRALGCGPGHPLVGVRDLSEKSAALMRPGRLVRVARRLAAVLGEGSGLAGGLAVAAWGEIRATRDVDFATVRPLAEVERALREAGLAFVTRRGDPLGRDLPWVVDGELEGVRFQVFAPRGERPFSTVSVSPPGGEGPAVRVLDLADLLRLKLEAGGPKDLWDVARLLRRYPEELPRTLAQASSLGVEDELRRWLEREKS